MPKPLVAVSGNVRPLSDDGFHGARELVLKAIYEGAGCMPMILPALGRDLVSDDLLQQIDGLVLTGAPSNVDPALYGDNRTVDPATLDQQRDATILPLLQAALDKGVPVLAICRGMQELNVLLGGTLQVLPNAEFGPHYTTSLQKDAHPLQLTPDGVLQKLINATVVNVNSSHQQAVGQLASALQVEATSADGIIEAVSVKGSTNFALGVQWHPEYHYATDAVSRPILSAFGAAARAHQLRKPHA